MRRVVLAGKPRCPLTRTSCLWRSHFRPKAIEPGYTTSSQFHVGVLAGQPGLVGVKQLRYAEEPCSNHGVVGARDQLAGSHRYDPHEYLKYLSTKWNWPPPDKLEGPPTTTHFPYQAQDRMDAVEALWTGVVKPSWRAYERGSFDDKKLWSTGFIHGTSGVGKTRFNLELLGLLADYLAARPARTDETESLRAALKNRKTVVLDIRNNGYALTEDEVKWPSQVILGLRLARQYWLTHVPYPEVRAAFRSQVLEDSTLWDTFALGRVLSAIQQHKAAPTRGDPSPRIPNVLHIAVDEIQSAFDIMVPYRGLAGRQSALEPLSTALNRALQGAISQSRGLFVLGTLSGTAARHAAEVLDPTDATTTGVLLSPLSAEPIRQLVASFRFKSLESGQPVTVSGQEWLDKGGKPFERLLATIGGNARALECLERVLENEGPPSKPLGLSRISAKLIKQVSQTFNIESWGRYGSGQFGLLLALAGIPVQRESVVAFEKPDALQQQQPRPITVAELERAGVVHLRPPPQSDPNQPDRWVNTWDAESYTVMEVPFVLAQAALAVVANHAHCQHDRKLIAGASNLLVDFYPTAASFEKLALEHRVLRHNVASEWARRQGHAYVEARDLFCGTICHPSLTKLRFVPATTVRHVSEPGAAGVWWKVAAKDGCPEAASAVPPTSVTLQDGSVVELASTSPYALLLSASNAVDGLLNEQLSDPLNKNVRVYIDTKHTQIGAPTDDALNYGDDIKALINKRRYLAAQFPNEEHVMVITSNKRAIQPGGKFHTATTLLRIPPGGAATGPADPQTCLITSTDDSLAWAISPTFAHFLV